VGKFIKLDFLPKVSKIRCMEEQNQPISTEKKSYKRIVFALISLVLIILLVSVGSYFLINNLNNDTPSAAQTIAEEDLAELTAEPTRTPSLEANFTCNDNKSLEVAFYNEGDFPSANLVMSDGTSVLLYQVESASGARYANSDESIVFFNSGNEAFVEENGEMSYEDCVKDS